MFNLQQTIALVQTNCDIADARHAREMGMCNYLLAMRDFYKWEQGLPFEHQVKKGDIGTWLSQREAKWDELENNDYCSISLDGHDHDPFDYLSINSALTAQGLVYGSGYGNWGKPHFFLARLQRSETRSNLAIWVTGHEYARDMSPPPAALNRNSIFLRMDVMQRWLLGKVEMWGLSKPESAFKAMLDCYGLGDSVESKLNIIAEHESETLILHELGEAMAEPLLGETWREMITSFKLRRCELVARAVRDNLADCLSTLPQLITAEGACSIHFYFANFDGLRRSLFPSMETAYERWQQSGDMDGLQSAIWAGSSHWLNVARQLMRTWVDNPAQAEIIIGSYGENFNEIML